jgi:bacillithiol biosynthesis cysteine-adding enzyme BshC
VADAPSLEILVGRPTGAPLVRDYLEGTPAARSFYSGHFGDPDAYREKAEEVDGRFDRAARERAAEAIRVTARVGATRLERFVAEDGYVVTTGQQPGLFGGPLYSLYKGITTVRLAEALEPLLGKPVLPLFWVASEDHDWAEANHTYLVDVDNDLHLSTLGDRPGDVHPPLHRIPLGPDAVAVRDAFIDALPRTDFSAPYIALLRDAVAEGATLPGSFLRIMEDLLGSMGLCFTDAADPVVKSTSAELLLDELTRSEETEAVLGATGARLEEAGYGLQVALMQGGVNLFLEGPLGRERLYRENGGVRLHASGEVLTLREVRARATQDPSVLSPNVLFRPVVESAVFPTLSYVAGPGETAYFGQLGDFFGAFGMRMPVVHPRLGATVVEGKVRKVLDKFGLEPTALERPFHEVAGDIAREEVPGDIRATLKGPAQHVRAQAFAALDEVERKVVQAVKRENDIALAQLEKARLHLYPDGRLQERVLNVFYYLARYGGAFLDEIHRRFDVKLR